ncbi:MAG: retropepsin-like aspartic protease [Planktothrix sp. GU0601_MAG3]|nr:MAG: retropepsin-like aspartic protease [Planktothrix sp. GU0601_MAG3]
MHNSPCFVRLVTHQVPNQSLSQFISRFSILLSTTGLIFTNGIGALSQEHPGCFLKTKAGEVMSLNGNLCIFPQTDEKMIGSPLSTPGVYQAKIIKKEQGIPIIEAIFNDQVTFEMMVDTGASGTVITPMMAGQLNVVPTGRVKADTPSQKGVEFDLGSIQSLNVAGAVKSNITVAIAPMLNVGLLGQDFFGEYDVTIKEDVVEFRSRQ